MTRVVAQAAEQFSKCGYPAGVAFEEDVVRHNNRRAAVLL
jgi:hypothetical protein